jgi:hypothetical protein
MNLAAAASALRRLPLFERVSLRLLHDLVDYASRQRWLDDDAADAPDARPRDERPTIRKLGLLRSRTPARRITDRDFQRGWLEQALDGSFSLEQALLGRRDAFFDLLAGERPDRPRPDPLPLHLLFLTKHERFGLTPSLAPDADLVSVGWCAPRSTCPSAPCSRCSTRAASRCASSTARSSPTGCPSRSTASKRAARAAASRQTFP